MTKHDDDAAERAARGFDSETLANESVSGFTRPGDLVERFRALEATVTELQARLDAELEQNANLSRELWRAGERLRTYQSMDKERFGFQTTAPPGIFLNDE